MKCGFKTNIKLTAIAETGHTITTSEGRVIHKKLASKPLKFQTSRKPEDQTRTHNRCRRCGTFSSGELCETHLRLEVTRQDANNNTESNEPSTSYTLPMMPSKKKRTYNRVEIYESPSRDSDSTSNDADKISSDEEDSPEDTGLKAEIGREIEKMRAQTPMPTSPMGCSTEIVTDTAQPDVSETPIRGQNTVDADEIEHENTDKTRLKQKTNLEPRRSERIRTAQRVVKLGGGEYF